jgi:hypothetical protein
MEGLMKVVKIIPGNAYLLETLEGQQFAKAINGKYLKGYYPSMWMKLKDLIASGQ